MIKAENLSKEYLNFDKIDNNFAFFEDKINYSSLKNDESTDFNLISKENIIFKKFM